MILVTGIGRCGTSTVARLLHEETHYCMGHHFAPADKWNPKGYYECWESFQTLQLEIDVEWSLGKYHARWECEKQYFGVKHPQICELPPEPLLAANLIIVCTRNRKAIVDSMMTFKKPSTWEEANEFYDYRLGHITNIMQQFPNVKTIDFTNHKTDQEVIDILYRWL
jgi:hypothetical protein